MSVLYETSFVPCSSHMFDCAKEYQIQGNFNSNQAVFSDPINTELTILRLEITEIRRKSETLYMMCQYRSPINQTCGLKICKYDTLVYLFPQMNNKKSL